MEAFIISGVYVTHSHTECCPRFIHSRVTIAGTKQCFPDLISSPTTVGAPGRHHVPYCMSSLALGIGHEESWSHRRCPLCWACFLPHMAVLSRVPGASIRLLAVTSLPPRVLFHPDHKWHSLMFLGEVQISGEITKLYNISYS